MTDEERSLLEDAMRVIRHYRGRVHVPAVDVPGYWSVGPVAGDAVAAADRVIVAARRLGIVAGDDW